MLFFVYNTEVADEGSVTVEADDEGQAIAKALGLGFDGCSIPEGTA